MIIDPKAKQTFVAVQNIRILGSMQPFKDLSNYSDVVANLVIAF